jgi:hypothetical protein
LQNSNSKGFTLVLSATALAFLIFSFALFGIAGARAVFGLMIASLPFYIILGCFNIARGEKTVFSILLGLTLFPSLAYFLGFMVSFRIAIAMAFIVFIGMSVALKKFKAKK